MICPHCGQDIWGRKHKAVKDEIIGAIKDYGPISARELATIVYSDDSDTMRRRVLVHVSQINAVERVIVNDFRGAKTPGYRYVGSAQ